MRKIFLTFFYSGLAPFAPGTFGTLAGALLGIAILKIAPVSTLVLLSVLITIVAVKEIDLEEKESGIHDSSYIVIDEVVGVWIAFIISGTSWSQIVLSIIFFRLFDILKPSIIGRIDKNVNGGLGVMGDDIVAGLFAGLSSAIVYGAILKFDI
ncbi:MAG: phosphatidylglycerophosphatase A [Sulfurospirillum sp.]|nr:MAG: phosphatidylglycerophosphatase A [Sulfurospirillum sp.]